MEGLGAGVGSQGGEGLLEPSLGPSPPETPGPGFTSKAVRDHVWTWALTWGPHMGCRACEGHELVCNDGTKECDFTKS